MIPADQYLSCNWGKGTWQAHLKKTINLHWTRYIAYYMEEPYGNLTTAIPSDDCEENAWKLNDVAISEEDKSMSNLKMYHHTITKLQPDTQYAIFVKTYTVDSTGGQSPVLYVRTLPSRPSMPLYLLAHSNSSSEIVVT